LDILHKGEMKVCRSVPDLPNLVVVRSIIGCILFGTSYTSVKALIYYSYVKPIRDSERRLLERELIEADIIGFQPKEHQ